MHISIIALNGSPASSVSGPLEIMNLAKQILPRHTPLTVELLSGQEEPQVHCSNQIALTCHASFREIPATDLVLLGAIGYPDAQALHFPEALLSWLRRQYDGGATIASICTGAFVLAATGLLAGKPATTHWRCTGLLQRRHRDVHVQPDALITHEDRLICAGGASAYQDLCLYLINLLWGSELAQTCAKILLIDLDRDSQARYAQFDPNRQHTDALVHQAQDWIAAQFQQTFSLATLADHCHISERQLKRRFKAATGISLLPYIQMLRIDWSKRQLEATSHTVEHIARASGYEDMRFFRDLFKRHTGLTPTDYRSKFRLSY